MLFRYKATFNYKSKACSASKIYYYNTNRSLDSLFTELQGYYIAKLKAKKDSVTLACNLHLDAGKVLVEVYGSNGEQICSFEPESDIMKKVELTSVRKGDRLVVHVVGTVASGTLEIKEE